MAACDSDRVLVASTANEVDNLKPIAFLQRGFCPAVSAGDLAIEFYRYAICFKVEELEELGERGA